MSEYGGEFLAHNTEQYFGERVPTFEESQTLATEITRFAKDPDWTARSKAAIGLGAIGMAAHARREAIPQLYHDLLVPLLVDPVVSVRQHAEDTMNIVSGEVDAWSV